MLYRCYREDLICSIRLNLHGKKCATLERVWSKSWIAMISVWFGEINYSRACFFFLIGVTDLLRPMLVSILDGLSDEMAKP